MKKFLLTLGLILALSHAQQSHAQIDVNLVDLKTNKTVAFNAIWETYKLDTSHPTLIITWSGEWCYPCINLINRYAKCDPRMLNLITINVDNLEQRDGVLADHYEAAWPNALNFHANLGATTKGFDNVFTVEHAPLILYIANGGLTDAVVNYDLMPYQLVLYGPISDVNFIWNSQEDLNSLAWNYYLNKEDPADLAKALTWVQRSIDLDKNYHNTDTYAALLYKTGAYTQALKAAKEAIEIGKATNTKYDSTTELINKIIEKL